MKSAKDLSFEYLIAAGAAAAHAANAEAILAGVVPARLGGQIDSASSQQSQDGTYYVQATGEKVVEASGEGFDAISESVTYALTGRYAEMLVLTGTGNLIGTGSSLSLIGNTGEYVLNGLSDHDTLTGGVGADLFLFETNSGKDAITDFTVSDGDLINLNASTDGLSNTGILGEAGVVSYWEGTSAIPALGAKMCKWPIGDPSGDSFGFCGYRVDDGTPYCAEHARVAYTRPSNSSKKGHVRPVDSPFKLRVSQKRNVALGPDKA